MSKNINIIDAFWEKRNLGISIYEVTIEERANVEELDSIDKLNGDLIFVKINSNNTDVIERISQKKFTYTENQFSIQKKIKNHIVSDLHLTTLKFLESHPISNLSEAEIIFDELDRGLFTTDRISLDKNFGIQTSNLRYKNWIYDMINSGNYECCIIRTKNNKTPVSFYINKYDGDISQCILGGVFNDFKNRGFGHSFIYFSIENSIKQNCKILKTQISSNNIPVFNIYSSVFGFEIKENYVVFKKHI